MKDLKSEIKTFNFIKLKMSSKWIVKNNIDNKIHSSIVIILNSAENAQACKNGLNIGGIRIKIDKFNSMSGSGRLSLRALGGKPSECFRDQIIITDCYTSSCN